MKYIAHVELYEPKRQTICLMQQGTQYVVSHTGDDGEEVTETWHGYQFASIAFQHWLSLAIQDV